MIDAERAIPEWFDFMDKLYAELRAMNDQINASLSRKLQEAGFRLDPELVERWNNDDGQHRCAELAFSQGLIEKHKRFSQRWLGWQISLAGDGVAVPGSKEIVPLVHVFYFSSPVDFDECYVGFPLDEPTELRSNRLVVWGDPGASARDREWMYSLRLFALNTPTDLERLIVDPAIALIKGSGVEVLTGASFDEALVKFPPAEVLAGNSRPSEAGW